MKNSNLIKVESGLLKHVSNTLSITNKLLSPDSRIIRILHLDDHLLYVRGVAMVIHKKFPNAIFKNFQDGSIALEYVIKNLEKGNEIDLIITDINHSGLRGIEFCNAVREKEKPYHVIIPILFITMLDDISIRKKAETYPSVIFLSKSSWGEEINLAITNLT